MAEGSGEGGIIETILARVPSAPPPEGPGDDAARIGSSGSAGAPFITTDLLVEGTHFHPRHPPADLGWKALAVNASDVAAMGARPEGFVLGLGLPGGWAPAKRVAWVEAFASGLGACARWAGMRLLGGDTVAAGEGVLIAITAWGALEDSGGAGLLRSGARPGDVLAVAGPIGRSARGLAAWLAAASGPPGAWPLEDPCVRAHLRPEPPLWAGPFALAHGATAGMDLSDGLATDLPRLAAASRCALRVDLERLPADPAFGPEGGLSAGEREARAAGGEDYGLLVTVPPARWREFERGGFIAIGEALEGPPGEVRWCHEGAEGPRPAGAFEHFR